MLGNNVFTTRVHHSCLASVLSNLKFRENSHIASKFKNSIDRDSCDKFVACILQFINIVIVKLTELRSG